MVCASIWTRSALLIDIKNIYFAKQSCRLPSSLGSVAEIHIFLIKPPYKSPNKPKTIWLIHLSPLHVATDTTTLEATAKNMTEAWLLETEMHPWCRLKCPLRESISSYLSVQLSFRVSFPHSQTLPPSWNSLSDSRVHLGSSVSKNADIRVPRLLSVCCLWTECVILTATFVSWMRNIFGFYYKTHEWILTNMLLTWRLGNGPTMHRSSEKPTCAPHWHTKLWLICSFPFTSNKQINVRANSQIWMSPKNVNVYSNAGLRHTVRPWLLERKFHRHWADIVERTK